jgi:putative addiction module component (TIGR02574 family)
MGCFAKSAFANPKAMNEAESGLHGTSAEMEIFHKIVQKEKEALQLSDCERAVLADRLLASLSRRPTGLDDAWLREADERMAAYREGRIEAVSGPEAMADLRGEFRR